MTEIFTAANIVGFLTLAGLEIVLGIDNIVFIAILTSKLPKEKQAGVRRIGLGLAMLQRIALLFAISWVMRLTDPVVMSFSGRDLILILGGIFLVGKSTYEVHGTMESAGVEEEAHHKTARASIGMILTQIALLDTVFSLDSVITAVGMVDNIPVMVAAVVASVAVMMVFANPVSNFIEKHPSIKMLALSFLMLIGVMLIADGLGHHVPKGYIYSAMGFSLLVEFLNFRLRKKSARVASKASAA